jgi:hypothetical protein
MRWKLKPFMYSIEIQARNADVYVNVGRLEVIMITINVGSKVDEPILDGIRN